MNKKLRVIGIDSKKYLELLDDPNIVFYVNAVVKDDPFSTFNVTEKYSCTSLEAKEVMKQALSSEGVNSALNKEIDKIAKERGIQLIRRDS